MKIIQPQIRFYHFNTLPDEIADTQFFFQIASNELKKSPYKIWRHGAVIADKHRKIIVSGFNGDTKGNSFFRHFYAKRFPGLTFHAEFSALGKIPNENVLTVLKTGIGPNILRDATIYSYRETRSGLPANSRPCEKICWKMLKKIGFKDAIYVYNFNGERYVAHEFF